MVILVDNRHITNPYINLAIEEYLVRTADCSKQDYLLLYINEPCIVLGKNQSVYKEVNFEYLRNGKLKLARRVSGGGTVYQDEGNLSFAFISSFSESKVNNYLFFNQPILDALSKIGVEAKQDERNNILCKGKKISGNAQFTNRKNIISHGTLLFNANLDVLRNCLKENDFKIESKAVSSQRSSVMNVCETCKGVFTIEQLRDFLIESLNVKESYHFNDDEWKQIEELARDKFQTFEWIYGRSPKTVVFKDGIQIEVEDGRITSLKSENETLRSLVGVRYEFKEVEKTLKNSPNNMELVKIMF